MKLIIDIPDAPIEDYQDLFYKIHSMAASEGLFDDKVKSQRALALKVVLDILDGIANGTPLEQIRDEIEQFVSVSISDVEVMPKNDVLQIIDKYKENKK